MKTAPIPASGGDRAVLFQQKQRELLVAVSRVDELSDQLEALRSNRLEHPLPPPHHHSSSSTAELECLYQELQLRNKLNQDQSGRLQQQRDSLNKRNLEVAAMGRRLAELWQRLWKKKAALQQKENLPVAPDGAPPQHGVVSRVAAVGPYIQSQGPPVPARQEVLVKPAYPDGTATLPMPDSSLKPPPRPAKPASGFTAAKTSKLSDWSGPFSESGGGYSHASTLPRMSSLSGHSSGGKTPTDQKGLSGSDVPPPVPSWTNHTAESLLRDNQASGKGLSKMAVPPPVPTKPKPFSSPGTPTFSKPPYSTGTFPGKVAPDGAPPQHGVVSRVAAVGPYIQSQGPPVPARQEVLVKPAYPDGTATLPMPDSSLKPPPRPAKPASGFTAAKTSKLSDWSGPFSESGGGYSHASTLPRMSSLSGHSSGGKTPTDQKGLSGSDVPPPVPSWTNHTAESLLRDNQASGKGLSKMAVPPPVPTKPKPFSSPGTPTFSKPPYSTGTFPGKVAPDGAPPQHGVVSRVAAVGPYIQSQGPPVPARQEVLVKPAYPDGTATLPMPDSSLKPPPRPAKPASGFTAAKTSKLSDWSGPFSESGGGYSHASTLPRMSSLSGHSSGGKTPTDQKGLSGSDVPPPVPSWTNHTAESLLRDNQASGKGLSKMAVPPPVPTKPKPFSSPGTPTFSKPPYSTGTFPGKVRPVGGHLRAPGVLSSHSHTLPLPNKQESPPATAICPYTPDLSEAAPTVLQKPQTLAALFIYSMYTQQATPGKGYQPGGQGTLPRSQPRVYGKPVLPASGGHQPAASDGGGMYSGCCVSDGSEADNSCLGNGEGVGAETAERGTPRPLSPTKLLPFLSNPHRNPSDADLEALRRRLHHAPRPLKKRSSITEPEGPAGPNIQKLLYQKTTLAAMETIPMESAGPAGTRPGAHEDRAGAADAGYHQPLAESPEDSLTPPPLPPRSPIPDPASCRSLPPPLEDKDEEEEKEEEVCRSTSRPQDYFADEFPPYPPPPYPTCSEAEQGDDVINLQPPEVTGQVTAPPGKKSILRKVGSVRIDHNMRVKFNPLALLLDSSLEGEYNLVQRVIYDVDNPSMPNDEGITALHNAVCAGHTEIVKFLVQYGVNANAADSNGWTPLHCAASCNNVQVCKFLVESGAAVFATTYSDMQTAADKCEEMEEGYAQCSQFLYGVQEKMGVMNRGVVYALWDYEPQSDDELGFSEGDCMAVLRREDEVETEWWWARCGDSEGYVPRNLLGLYLRIKPRQRSLA